MTESYLYDAAGNLTKKGNKDYSYDVSNQITTTGFEYNDNGNLASDGTNSYQYDAENRLTQVNKVSDSSLVATYTYYHDGLRKSKTVTASGVTTQQTTIGMLPVILCGKAIATELLLQVIIMLEKTT